MKRSKYSFHDFSAKHTPSATLREDNVVQGSNINKFSEIKMLPDDLTLA